jgi:hypothetical protein
LFHPAPLKIQGLGKAQTPWGPIEPPTEETQS